MDDDYTDFLAFCHENGLSPDANASWLAFDRESEFQELLADIRKDREDA